MAASASTSSRAHQNARSAASANYPALHLTIRFSTAHPDLEFGQIFHPETNTGLSLLGKIRRHLPEPQARCKILLIASGRVIPLKDSLATSLRLRDISNLDLDIVRREVHDDVVQDSREVSSFKDKGKEKVFHTDSTSSNGHEHDEDEEDAVEDSRERIVLRQIIHATFSNPDMGLLSEAELENEYIEGLALNAALREQQRQRQRNQQNSSWPDSNTLQSMPSSRQHNQPEQRYQPLLGFSRLRSTGIPEAEIAALRRQFRAILAAEHPDAAPPTPIELLELEDRWLDSNDTTSGRNVSSMAIMNISTEDSNSQSAYTSDILWGNILGFFWPLGALFVLGRQQGIWRDARGLAVVVGALVNVGFCLFRFALIGAGTEMANATRDE